MSFIIEKIKNSNDKKNIIIQATDMCVPIHIFNFCRENLLKATNFNIYIIYRGNKKRCLRTMNEQLLEGLSSVVAENVYVTEHDVLYTPEHFLFTPKNNDTFYYPKWLWRMSKHGLYKSTSMVTSGLVCKYCLLLSVLQQRLSNYGSKKQIKFDEFGKRNEYNTKVSRFDNLYGNIDVRHNKCYTGGKGNEYMRERNANYQKNILYWGDVKKLSDILFGSEYE